MAKKKIKEKELTLKERIERIYQTGLIGKLLYRNMQIAEQNQSKKRYTNLEMVVKRFE